MTSMVLGLKKEIVLLSLQRQGLLSPELSESIESRFNLFVDCNLTKKRSFVNDLDLNKQTEFFVRNVLHEDCLSKESIDALVYLLYLNHLERTLNRAKKMFGDELAAVEVAFVEKCEFLLNEITTVIYNTEFFNDITIDPNEVEGVKSNSILNQDNRNIIIASYAVKTIMPVVTEFLRLCKANTNRVISSLSIIAFNQLTLLTGYDTKYKITFIVKNRVDNAAYANKVIWNYIYNEGITIDYFNAIQGRTLLSGLPKIKIPLEITEESDLEVTDKSFSTVAFVHTFVIQQQNFLFSKKLQHNYRVNPFEDFSLVTVFDTSFSPPSSNAGLKQTNIFAFTDKKRKMFEEVKHLLPVSFRHEINCLTSEIDLTESIHLNLILKNESYEYLNAQEYLTKKSVIEYAYYLSFKLRHKGFTTISQILLAAIEIPKKKLTMDDLNLFDFSDDSPIRTLHAFKPKLKVATLISNSTFVDPKTKVVLDIQKRQLAGELARFIKDAKS